MTDQFRQQGAFSWVQLVTSDVKGAEAFYKRIFGWSTEPWNGEIDYTLIKVEGKEVGGMMTNRVPESRSRWGVFVTVTDVDETARMVPELGGKVLMGPKDIPRVGRFCVLEDPQGAVITAITYSR